MKLINSLEFAVCSILFSAAKLFNLSFSCEIEKINTEIDTLYTNLFQLETDETQQNIENDQKNGENILLKIESKLLYSSICSIFKSAQMPKIAKKEQEKLGQILENHKNLSSEFSKSVTNNCEFWKFWRKMAADFGKTIKMANGKINFECQNRKLIRRFESAVEDAFAEDILMGHFHALSQLLAPKNGHEKRIEIGKMDENSNKNWNFNGFFKAEKMKNESNLAFLMRKWRIDGNVNGIIEIKRRIEQHFGTQFFEKMELVRPIEMTFDIINYQRLANLYVKILQKEDATLAQQNEVDLTTRIFFGQIIDIFALSNSFGKMKIKGRKDNETMKKIYPEIKKLWSENQIKTNVEENSVEKIYKFWHKLANLHNKIPILKRHEKVLIIYDEFAHQRTNELLWRAKDQLMVEHSEIVTQLTVCQSAECQNALSRFLAHSIGQMKGAKHRLRTFFTSPLKGTAILDNLLQGNASFAQVFRSDLTSDEISQLQVKYYLNYMDSDSETDVHTRALFMANFLAFYHWFKKRQHKLTKEMQPDLENLFFKIELQMDLIAWSESATDKAAKKAHKREMMSLRSDKDKLFPEEAQVIVIEKGEGNRSNLLAIEISLLTMHDEIMEELIENEQHFLDKVKTIFIDVQRLQKMIPRMTLAYQSLMENAKGSKQQRNENENNGKEDDEEKGKGRGEIVEEKGEERGGANGEVEGGGEKGKADEKGDEKTRGREQKRGEMEPDGEKRNAEEKGEEKGEERGGADEEIEGGEEKERVSQKVGENNGGRRVENADEKIREIEEKEDQEKRKAEEKGEKRGGADGEKGEEKDGEIIEEGDKKGREKGSESGRADNERCVDSDADSDLISCYQHLMLADRPISSRDKKLLEVNTVYYQLKSLINQLLSIIKQIKKGVAIEIEIMAQKTLLLGKPENFDEKIVKICYLKSFWAYVISNRNLYNESESWRTYFTYNFAGKLNVPFATEEEHKWDNSICEEMKNVLEIFQSFLKSPTFEGTQEFVLNNLLEKNKKFVDFINYNFGKMPIFKKYAKFDDFHEMDLFYLALFSSTDSDTTFQAEIFLGLKLMETLIDQGEKEVINPANFTEITTIRAKLRAMMAVQLHFWHAEKFRIICGQIAYVTYLVQKRRIPSTDWRSPTECFLMDREDILSSMRTVLRSFHWDFVVNRVTGTVRNGISDTVRHKRGAIALLEKLIGGTALVKLWENKEARAKLMEANFFFDKNRLIDHYVSILLNANIVPDSVDRMRRDIKSADLIVWAQWFQSLIEQQHKGKSRHSLHRDYVWMYLRIAYDMYDLGTEKSEFEHTFTKMETMMRKITKLLISSSAGSRGSLMGKLREKWDEIIMEVFPGSNLELEESVEQEMNITEFMQQLHHSMIRKLWQNIHKSDAIVQRKFENIIKGLSESKNCRNNLANFLSKEQMREIFQFVGIRLEEKEFEGTDQKMTVPSDDQTETEKGKDQQKKKQRKNRRKKNGPKLGIIEETESEKGEDKTESKSEEKGKSEKESDEKWTKKEKKEEKMEEKEKEENEKWRENGKEHEEKRGKEEKMEETERKLIKRKKEIKKSEENMENISEEKKKMKKKELSKIEKSEEKERVENQSINLQIEKEKIEKHANELLKTKEFDDENFIFGAYKKYFMETEKAENAIIWVDIMAIANEIEDKLKVIKEIGKLNFVNYEFMEGKLLENLKEKWQKIKENENYEKLKRKMFKFLNEILIHSEMRGHFIQNCEENSEENENQKLLCRIHQKNLANAIKMDEFKQKWHGMATGDKEEKLIHLFKNNIFIISKLEKHAINAQKMMAQIEIDQNLLNQMMANGLTNEFAGCLSPSFPKISQQLIRDEFDEQNSQKLEQFVEEMAFNGKTADGISRKKRDKQIKAAVNTIKGMAAKWSTDKAKLFISGSFMFGLNTTDSDIDLICVVPGNVIKKENFLGEQNEICVEKKCQNGEEGEKQNLSTPKAFYCHLCENEKVIDLLKISHGQLMMLKLTFDGFDFDISFVAIPKLETLEQRITDRTLRNYLTKFDTENVEHRQMLRVLTSYLSNVHIIKLMDENQKNTFIPNSDISDGKMRQNGRNYENLRFLILALKLWAKGNFIYSNKFGFLNGVILTIMASKIALLYPNSSLHFLLCKFFLIYAARPFGLPIQIEQINEKSKANPFLTKNPMENEIKIYTAVFPQQNAARLITFTNAKIIRKEMTEALNKLINFDGHLFDWSSLLSPNSIDFVEKYENFIAINCIGQDKISVQNFCQFVETRIRLQLEFDINNRGTTTNWHIYPALFQETCKITQKLEEIPAKNRSDFHHCKVWLIGTDQQFVNANEKRLTNGKLLNIDWAIKRDFLKFNGKLSNKSGGNDNNDQFQQMGLNLKSVFVPNMAHLLKSN